MVVLVVSPSSSLTVGLGARLSTVGVGPAELSAWLREAPPLAGAVIDDAAGADVALASARLIRDVDRTCPLLLVVSAGVSPDRQTVSGLDPVRLVRRPFTAAQLAAELSQLGSQRLEDDATQTSVLGSTDAAVGPVAAVQEDALPTPVADRRSRRRTTPTDTQAAAPTSVRSALGILAAAPLVSMPEALADVLDALESTATEQTAVALMIAGAQGWEVAGGRGLRQNERRIILSPGHWLARKVAEGEVAVVVSGTDIARQELQSVPLIAFDHWMATTLPRTPLMALFARAEEPAFQVADALEARKAVEPLVARVEEALLTREVARRLEPYRD